MATIYTEDTLEKLRARIEPLAVLKAINYRLETVQEVPGSIKCFCPIHHEAVFRTLIIDLRTRRYRCSYSLCPGHQGGDMIDLYAKATKAEYDDAVRQLVQQLSVSMELPDTEDSVQKTLEVSQNYLALGSFADALAGFNKILSIQSDHVPALVGLLQIHRARKEEDPMLEVLGRLVGTTSAQEKFAESAGYCREILERRPNDLAIHLKYVECLVAQGETQQALEEYMHLADIFETRREFDRALEMYRKIEQLNLDIIDVYPHIIQLMVASDRTRDAVEETMKKAAECERQGDFEHVLECYRYILEMDETRADVREKMVAVTIQAGLSEKRIEQCLALVEDFIREESYANATRAIEALRKAAPDHLGIMAKHVDLLRRQSREQAATEAEIEMIGRLIEQGRSEEAAGLLRSFGTMLALSPELMSQLAAAQHLCGLTTEAAETYSTLADRLAEANRFEEAIHACDSAIALKPTEVSYRGRQVDLFQRLGQMDRAREKYLALVEMTVAERKWGEADIFVARALELTPDDPQLVEYQAQILTAAGQVAVAQERSLTLARNHVAAQHWDAAKRVLQRVLAADADHIEAALLLADVAIAQDDPRMARDHLQRVASRLLAQKDYGRAESALVKLAELTPADPFVLVQLASVYTGLGDENKLAETYRHLVAAYIANEVYPKALEYCTAILDRDPENIWALEQMLKVYEKTDKLRSIPELCLRLARVYGKLNEADRVQEYYERALAGEPANTQARGEYLQFLVGLHRYEAASSQAQIAVTCLTEQHRYEEAMQLVEGLLEHTPDDVALRRLLIELCRQGGQEREFVTQCTQLINLHYRRNEFSEVADLYRQLLESEPDNVTFRTHLIDALMRLKRRDEAVEQYFQLVDRYMRHGNLEDAENTLVELLDQSPDNTHGLEVLIGVLIQAGRAEQAIQRARGLSEIYVAAGKNDKAVEVLQRILVFDPNNREILQWINEIGRRGQQAQQSLEDLAARADAQWQQGQTEAALESQREAVRLQPDNTAVRRRLAEMLEHVGNEAASLDERLQVARLRADRGEFKEAIEVLDEILARDPTHYDARRLRAEMFAKGGDPQRALEEFMQLAPGAGAPAPSNTPSTATPVSVVIPPEPLQVVPSFTFENFVVGDRNRFAAATALAVAKAPAAHYNPLFLYSDVGLGKTHLVSAIANYIAEHQPDLRILYTSAEEFTSQLVEAIQNNTINAFRSRYKAADILLVDDIHFLAGKERAQEELFTIFNTLFQAKRQMVMTSDRPPKEIAHLEKRLKSRFGAGVIVDIQPPDFETRAAILKKELEQRSDLQVDNRLINLIAEQITSNVRELKGVLNQVLVKHDLSGAEISETLVRDVLTMYTQAQ